VRIEQLAGVDPITARARAKRNHPELYRQLLKHNGLEEAERRKQLNAGWAAAVSIEQLAGADPITARARAQRNHPELHRQFMKANGQNID
jgi:hypothetical protein